LLKRKFNRAVRKLPKCIKPVGLGQNLVFFVAIRLIKWKQVYKVRIISLQINQFERK